MLRVELRTREQYPNPFLPASFFPREEDYEREEFPADFPSKKATFFVDIVKMIMIYFFISD